MPEVPHPRPDTKRSPHTLLGCTGMERFSTPSEYLIAPYLDQHRRKISKIGIQGRKQGVTWIGCASIGIQVEHCETGVGHHVVLMVEGSPALEIERRADGHGSRWQRIARLPKCQEGCDDEVTAGGLAGEYDIFWLVTGLPSKPPVGGDAVEQSCREGMFGREPVVHEQSACACFSGQVCSRVS